MPNGADCAFSCEDLDGDSRGDCVVVAWSGTVHLLSGAEGRLLASFGPGQGLYSVGTIGGLLLAGSDRDGPGRLWAVTGRSGVELWRVRLEKYPALDVRPFGEAGDLDGDGAKDAILWTGRSIAAVRGGKWVSGTRCPSR